MTCAMIQLFGIRDIWIDILKMNVKNNLVIDDWGIQVRRVRRMLLDFTNDTYHKHTI